MHVIYVAETLNPRRKSYNYSFAAIGVSQPKLLGIIKKISGTKVVLPCTHPALGKSVMVTLVQGDPHAEQREQEFFSALRVFIALTVHKCSIEEVVFVDK